MHRRLLSALFGALLFFTYAAAAAEVPAPEKFFGRRLGEDRYLAPYPKLLEYFHALAAASNRVSVQSVGKSTLGNEMVLVVLTSPANQQRLDHYRSIARQLANPDELSPEQARKLIAEGKTILFITCSIHSTEVASTQMAAEFAYQLATATDPALLSWMDDVILLLMPSLNPDGQVMVLDWYNKYVGSEYEGGSMPWLYHHYVGHDNNRDFYMLTQKESQVFNDVMYHQWFPQVYLDMHQMGSTGARLFVPPETDPTAMEVNALLIRYQGLIGNVMAVRLEEAGKSGIGQGMLYDSYWPGGTGNTAWFKNVIGLLTEAASTRIATPIYIEPGELRGNAKGFPDYVKRANFPSPWPGGWWRLRDIMDYEHVAVRALLESCARYRQNLLEVAYRLGRDSIERGATEPPYAFLVPPAQHDPVATARFLDILLRNGVRIERAEAAFTVGNASYPAGTYVIRAAQPYRPFLLTMLRPQRYPEVLAAVGASILPPYDVTSWSLPLAMGVDVVEVGVPLKAQLKRLQAPEWPGGTVHAGAGGYLIPHSADSAFTLMNRLLKDKKNVYWLKQASAGGAVGDIYVPASQATAELMTQLSSELHVPVRALETAPAGPALSVQGTRVGLYKPWIASMDEGWTRWLLERYEFPFVNLSNQQLKDGSFKDQIDVLLLPDVRKTIIEKGEPPEEFRRFFTPLPPEYAGGIGKEGGENIKKWVEQGGTVVAMSTSADYLIDLLQLPVTNVLDKVPREKFNCPGSMLRLLVDNRHPLAYGMDETEAGFFDNSPAFETRLPDARFDRRVVASYPEHEDQILVSGYLKGGELLERRASVVELKVAKGRIVLIGFRPQFRAQPHRTFKLLFNALYWPKLTEASF